jgi:two-component system cell cycle sensor histidine kinase/response regulator CckA
MAETILVLEDDEWMRDIATLVLERAGYSVLAAATGEEAVALAADPAQKHIHLLLADAVLPGISGSDAAGLIQKVWPNIRVLFMSGYGEEILRRYNIPVTQTGFIQKPFTNDALLSKVKRLLDQRHVALARREIRNQEAQDRLSYSRVA